MSTPVHVENDSALARVFKDKKKLRQRLGQLWEENSRLEKLVTSNKEEQVRLEQSVKGNKMELGRLEVLINVNRGEILQANQENEKLDKKLEITVMERVEPQPVLVRDNGMEKDYVKERLAEKKKLESNICKSRDQIAESGRNLSEHQAELATMLEQEGAAGYMYEVKMQEVEGYKEVHRKCKEKMLSRITTMKARLQQIEHECTEEDAGNVVAEPSSSNSSKKLSSRDEDVVIVMEERKRKMPAKEKEKIVPKVFKTEVEDSEESYPAYSCSQCRRRLSSAAAMVSHMENHFPRGSPIPCPFPRCIFSSQVEGLTRHVRSKHTGEKLFHCSKCSTKLPSYHALVDHDRKHSNQQMVQCMSCLKFHKLEGRGCHFCRI